MGLFIQLVVDGLAIGAVYAVLALAIVIVNRSTGIINFSQGAMAVFITFICFALTAAGLPLVAAMPISIVIALVFGALIERLIIRRFEGGDPDTSVVVTVGLMMLLTGIAGSIWGYNPYRFESLFPLESVEVLGARIGWRSIGTIAVVVVAVVLLQLVFMRTKIGLAMRAVADNPQSSALSGLPVGRLLMLGWGLAAAFGALGGILVAPQLSLTPEMLNPVLIYALAAAILGGLDSPLGAVVAAGIIGVVESLAGAYIPFIGQDLKIAVPLVVMLIVLIVRPQGLFGGRQVVRV